ncbi:CoA transferase [Mycobacterium sp. MYCO198283]|uniref:CaiB/BaiF CoA-transferase family protein n=1 Tax=Mycobacterium sp. MYCO198283 TaxID=2883505 RepID=UPI001E433B52|nr:CoA transferase [Mycobacterium sp. MYCO198283]MCG5434194.1 CoA transferase [Mycobacterium sp. MYCO198283]
MSAAPLDGYTVVELATGIAGAYCTKLLGDGGAEVIKVEGPHGDPLRRWSASGAELDGDGALFGYLCGGKHSVVAEHVEHVDALLAGADAVVWSPGSPLAEADALRPAQIHRRHPHLVVTAITPFGLEGPWAGRPATEFTLQAWSGGIVGLGRGAPDRAPVHVGGQVGEYLAGAYAAALTLASRAGALADGRGELIDLSMLETSILGLTYYPVTFFEMLGRPWRTARKVTVPGVAQAADGLVDVGCGTAQQWFDLCAMLGHDEWIDEESTLTITEQATAKADEIYAWFAEHPSDEIRELASAFRIPNAPVANGANVDTLDHYRERGSFVDHPAGFRQPGPPYRIAGARLHGPRLAPALGEHTAQYPRNRIPGRESAAQATGNAVSRGERLPLAGVRVLDMTTFWAGPSCTHLMAMLGADVIHVESARRPDGTRLIAGVPVDVPQWWERSPIFSGLNTDKRGITLDLQRPAGRDVLSRLITTCDVIVENFTPRVLDQLGLDFAAVTALRPDAVMVRMPGFGLDGPWRDNPAFAYVIEAAAGISWLTGYPDRLPYEPYSLGDPNAGIHALVGVLLALEHRRRTGEGTLVEAAMVDAALAIAAEQVIEHSAYGALLQRDGNRGPAAAPQNCYLTADIDEFGRLDSWVAIAVATDEQWAGLVDALGHPAWTADTDLASAAGRRARHDEIDAQLSPWCATRSADEIVDTLWAAGVPVAKVLQPHRQTEIPQLAHRRFFEPVGHPVNDEAPHSTVPARFSLGPLRYHRSPAPLLGEHNRDVFTAIGLDEHDIEQLAADGVIGEAPAGFGSKV